MKHAFLGAFALLLSAVSCSDDDDNNGSGTPAYPGTPKISARITEQVAQDAPVHRHSRNLPLQDGRIRLFRQLHQRQTDDLQRVLHDRTGRRLREQQPGTPSADRSLQHGLLGHSQARGTDSQFARDQQPGHRQGSQSRRHVLRSLRPYGGREPTNRSGHDPRSTPYRRPGSDRKSSIRASSASVPD